MTKRIVVDRIRTYAPERNRFRVCRVNHSATTTFFLLDVDVKVVVTFSCFIQQPGKIEMVLLFCFFFLPLFP